MKPPKQERGLSEWGEEDEIRLSQLQERLRNERSEVEPESNEGSDVKPSESEEESSEWKKDGIPLSQPP